MKKKQTLHLCEMAVGSKPPSPDELLQDGLLHGELHQDELLQDELLQDQSHLSRSFSATSLASLIAAARAFPFRLAAIDAPRRAIS